ncbi:MAG TPA: DUF4173 domain-containing protein, partial [Gemmatimonadales bacterium]|nr:DUF4173 domain-containing protein [Gemmatimonadales bacterium]
MTPYNPVANPVRPAPHMMLRHALLAGVAADLLLRDQAGLGLPIWIAILSLAMISLARSAGRFLSAQAAGWLLIALLYAAGFAWRDSETLQFLDVVAVIGALGMTALSLSDPRVALFANRLRDTVWGSGTVLVSVAAGLIPLRLFAPEQRAARRGLGPAVRAAGIVAMMLVVFGSLLRGADPIFASLVVVPGFDPDAVVGHLMVAGFFTWIVCGWSRSALVVEAGKYPAPDRFPWSLGTLEITAALGTLVVLFTAFVAAQLGWFFGGERFLRERTGLTAAEYARGGFFQMVWVAILVLAVLLATRAMLRPGRALAWRHTALSLPVVALLGAIILSAALRMQLYVRYFGLTTDRLYTLVFMGWLGVVLVWFAGTVLRGWGRPFVAGAVGSGLITLAAL